MKSMLVNLSLITMLALASVAQTTPEVPQPPQAPAAPQAGEEGKPSRQLRSGRDRAPGPRVNRYVYTTGSPSSYLGLGVQDVSSDRVATLKLKDDSGVEVVNVDQDGPAAKAGVKPHDVLVSFNGQPLESYEQLKRLLRETPAGRNVKLGISRDGQQQTINVTLGKREDTIAFRSMHIDVPRIPPMPMMDMDVPGFTVIPYSTRSGLTVEDLTKQLGDFFGVKDGGGVLVRSVERGSVAEGAGLKAGDVIVKVNNERVANSAEWRRLMRKHSGAVTVGIIRDRRESSVQLKLPERRTTGDLDLPEFDGIELEAHMRDLKPELDRMRKDLERSLRELREQREELDVIHHEEN